MEPLWSPVVATGGRRSQIEQARGPPKQAKTVAVGCDQLPFGAHGKEGVDGSSPSEGSRKKARKRGALPRGELNGGEGRNRNSSPSRWQRLGHRCREPTRSASVRVLVLPPGARLGGLGFRRSLEQEAVVRRDERVGRHHRVGVVDGPVLAREGDPARALAQPVLELGPDLA